SAEAQRKFGNLSDAARRSWSALSAARAMIRSAVGGNIADYWLRQALMFRPRGISAYQINWRASFDLVGTKCVGIRASESLKVPTTLSILLPNLWREEPSTQFEMLETREDPNKISTVAGSRSYPTHRGGGENQGRHHHPRHRQG